MVNFNGIKLLFSAFWNRVELYIFRIKIQSKVRKLRAKEKIKVLFVLSDISLWKTEGLYRAMLEHPRFAPILGTCLITADVPSEAIRKYKSLIDYLVSKKYSYREVFNLRTNQIVPDLVFYQQPYQDVISPNVFFHSLLNTDTLICDVHYSMRTLAINKKNKWVIDECLYRYCWQIYVENELTAAYGKISVLRGKNIVITGMPIQDELSKDKSQYINPWKEQNCVKKRIIFAPHHTIPTANNIIHFSCFLDVADLMLEMAEKYSDKVQFAFKPHPFLKKKLIQCWGVEKTEKYYQKWNEMTNTQLSEGEYLSLFAYSDAMIHDSVSFVLEYSFTKKPVLLLENLLQNATRRNKLNQFAQKAYDLHDKGSTKDKIEQFILNVIVGNDSRKEEREEFYKLYLLPPHNKSASQNIINAILGIEEYANN